MSLKVIVFDFDGVLVDSVDIKTQAFAQLFRPFGYEIEHKVVEHHKKNGGMSRFEKFRYYYSEFLKRHLDDPTFQKLCDEFSSIVFNKIIEAPWITGALDFINDPPQLPIYIISATPQDEIKDIVSRRGVLSRFKGIFGSPTPKAEWLRIIAMKEGCTPKEILFIGDALNDYSAAIETGCRFIACVKEKDNPFVNLKNVDFIIADLKDLHSIINKY